MRRLILALTTVAACFAEANPAAESGDTGMPCPEGSSGCACYGNMTCDDALVCDEGFCIDPQCVDGTENCPCLPSGGCDVGLACDGVLCKPPSGTGSGDGATTVDSLTGAEVGPGESGVTSTTTDTNTGPETFSEGTMSSMSDSVGSCPGCPYGEVCDPIEGFCVSPAPYTPCDMNCSCLQTADAAEICIVDCSQNSCPLVPPLPEPTCFSPLRGSPVCIIDCTLDPLVCPPEMFCSQFQDVDPIASACMWL